MFLLFFFQDAGSFDLKNWLGEGVTFSLVVVFMWFCLKALPTWKEVQLERMKVRDKESESLGALGNSLGQLSSSLTQNSEVMNNIALEQRKATENVLILQRVSADQSNKLADSVDTLTNRIETLEEKIKC